MRKFIFMFLTLFCLFGLYENASANTPLSNYSEDDIQEMIAKDYDNLQNRLSYIDRLYEESNANSIEEIEKIRQQKSQAITNAINTISVLTLTEGFSDTYTSTFNKAKTISIKAPEGTTLAVIVYNDENQEIFKKEKVIGASKMYDLNIPLELGYNQIIVYVYYDTEDRAREYIVNRKSEDTKNSLQDLDLNKLLVP